MYTVTSESILERVYMGDVRVSTTNIYWEMKGDHGSTLCFSFRDIERLATRLKTTKLKPFSAL